MRVIITDSGLGGLSIAAHWIKKLVSGQKGTVDLKYINAIPGQHRGYNSMSSRQEKLSTFDRFLTTVSARYQPDYIYVACNSLAVLLPETDFAGSSSIKTDGIVATGFELLIEAYRLHPDRAIILLATETTISEGTYQKRLFENRGLGNI